MKRAYYTIRFTHLDEVELVLQVAVCGGGAHGALEVDLHLKEGRVLVVGGFALTTAVQHYMHGAGPLQHCSQQQPHTH